MSNLDNATLNLITIKDTEVSNNIVETFNRKDKRFYFNIEYINNDLLESTDSNNNDLFIRSVNNNIALITNNDNAINMYGPTVFKNIFTANKLAKFNNNLRVIGSSLLDGPTFLGSSTTSNSSLTCNGIVNINATLTVSKSSLFSKPVTLDNDVNISKKLNITGNIDFSNTFGINLPKGTNNQRINENFELNAGTIRFNTDQNTFEGYNGNNWGSLGGLIDVSRTTFIQAESVPGADNRSLDFYTNTIERMRINKDGDLLFGDISNDNIFFNIDYLNNKTNIVNLDVSNIDASFMRINKIDISDLVLDSITVNNLNIINNLDISFIHVKDFDSSFINTQDISVNNNLYVNNEILLKDINLYSKIIDLSNKLQILDNSFNSLQLVGSAQPSIIRIYDNSNNIYLKDISNIISYDISNLEINILFSQPVDICNNNIENATIINNIENRIQYSANINFGDLCDNIITKNIIFQPGAFTNDSGYINFLNNNYTFTREKQPDITKPVISSVINNTIITYDVSIITLEINISEDVRFTNLNSYEFGLNIQFNNQNITNWDSTISGFENIPNNTIDISNFLYSTFFNKIILTINLPESLVNDVNSQLILTSHENIVEDIEGNTNNESIIILTRQGNPLTSRTILFSNFSNTINEFDLYLKGVSNLEISGGLAEALNPIITLSGDYTIIESTPNNNNIITEPSGIFLNIIYLPINNENFLIDISKSLFLNNNLNEIGINIDAFFNISEVAIELNYMSNLIMEYTSNNVISNNLLSFWQANYVANDMGQLSENYFPENKNLLDIVDVDNSKTITGYVFKNNNNFLVPFENNSIINSLFSNLDINLGSALTFEVWISYNDLNNYPLLSNSLCWILSYETSWGPALTLNDNRLGKNSQNNSNICVSSVPEDSNLKSNVSQFGLISNANNKNKYFHIVGYYYSNKLTKMIDKGTYINSQHRPQESSLLYPGFDGVNGPSITHPYHLQLGGYTSGDSGHSCQGITLYGFRVWNKFLSQDEVNYLYSLGPNGIAIDYSPYVSKLIIPDVNIVIKNFGTIYDIQITNELNNNLIVISQNNSNKNYSGEYIRFNSNIIRLNEKIVNKDFLVSENNVQTYTYYTFTNCNDYITNYSNNVEVNNNLNNSSINNDEYVQVLSIRNDNMHINGWTYYDSTSNNLGMSLKDYNNFLNKDPCGKDLEIKIELYALTDNNINGQEILTQTNYYYGWDLEFALADNSGSNTGNRIITSKTQTTSFNDLISTHTGINGKVYAKRDLNYNNIYETEYKEYDLTNHNQCCKNSSYPDKWIWGFVTMPSDVSFNWNTDNNIYSNIVSPYINGNHGFQMDPKWNPLTRIRIDTSNSFLSEESQNQKWSGNKYFVYKLYVKTDNLNYTINELSNNILTTNDEYIIINDYNYVQNSNVNLLSTENIDNIPFKYINKIQNSSFTYNTLEYVPYAKIEIGNIDISSNSDGIIKFNYKDNTNNTYSDIFKIKGSSGLVFFIENSTNDNSGGYWTSDVYMSGLYSNNDFSYLTNNYSIECKSSSYGKNHWTFETNSYYLQNIEIESNSNNAIFNNITIRHLEYNTIKVNLKDNTQYSSLNYESLILNNYFVENIFNIYNNSSLDTTKGLKYIASTEFLDNINNGYTSDGSEIMTLNNFITYTDVLYANSSIYNLWKPNNNFVSNYHMFVKLLRPNNPTNISQSLWYDLNYSDNQILYPESIDPDENNTNNITNDFVTFFNRLDLYILYIGERNLSNYYWYGNIIISSVNTNSASQLQIINYRDNSILGTVNLNSSQDQTFTITKNNNAFKLIFNYIINNNERFDYINVSGTNKVEVNGNLPIFIPNVDLNSNIDISINIDPAVTTLPWGNGTFGNNDVNNTESIFYIDSDPSNNLTTVFVLHCDINAGDINNKYAEIRFVYSNVTHIFRHVGNGSRRFYDFSTQAWGLYFGTGIHSSSLSEYAGANSNDYFVKCLTITGTSTWYFQNTQNAIDNYGVLKRVELFDNANWGGMKGITVLKTDDFNESTYFP